MFRFKLKSRIILIAAFMLSFGWLNSAAVLAQDSATPLFSDVSADHWAAAAISSMVELGVADGYADGTFRPDAAVSREQFAKLLAMTLKLTIPATTALVYADVPADRWSAPYIEAVKGYIPGKMQPDGRLSFEPETAITREEVAAAIGRQYLEGYPDGTSRPQESLTRAEAMTVLSRLVAEPQTAATTPTAAPSTPSTAASPSSEPPQAASPPTAASSAAETSTAAPIIEIDKIPETVYFKDLHISGRVTDKGDPIPTLTLNGEKIWFSGSFETVLPLAEGENTLRFAATNSSGKTTERVMKVTYAIQPPQITVSRLPIKSVDLTEPVTIDVQDWYDKKAQIYINQKLVGSGSYTGELALNEGTNVFEITAVNSLGKSSTVTKTVEGMILPPTLKVDSMPETTNQKTITVTAWASDYYDYAPFVYINNQYINVRSGSATITLKEGPNVINFKATNYLGKNTVIIKTITLVPSR